MLIVAFVLLWVVSVVLVVISILRVLLSEAVLTRVKIHVTLILLVFTLLFIIHHDPGVLHFHHLVQFLKQCVVIFLKSKVKLKIFFVKLRRKRM